MVKTFDNLYQGLAVDNITTPLEASKIIAPTPSNGNATNPERTPVADDQIDKFQNLFSKPFHQFFGKNPALDVSTSDFCWAGLVLGFEEPTWETVHVEDQRQRHSRTQSRSLNASTLESAPDKQTPPLADVPDVHHEQISNTGTPHWDSCSTPFAHDHRPHR